MSRDGIREMKRRLRAGVDGQASEEERRLAEASALALLERSVRMRHRRLAVQRLNDAVALGVPVPDEHWLYCRSAAAASHDKAVQALFSQSDHAAHAAGASPDGGLRHG
jgi:hypothetical protein